VCDAEVRNIARPQRKKVFRQADLATTVHFDCLAVQAGQFELRGGGGICNGHVELQGKTVLFVLVDVPALAEPARPFVVGFESEPVIVVLFVDLHVLLANMLSAPGLIYNDERPTLISELYSSSNLWSNCVNRPQ
jgi:hypothetical protein